MTVTYDVTGRPAFITGGSAGMGEATVRALVDAGANVAIADLGTAARSGSSSVDGPGLLSHAEPGCVVAWPAVKCAKRGTRGVQDPEGSSKQPRRHKAIRIS